VKSIFRSNTKKLREKKLPLTLLLVEFLLNQNDDGSEPNLVLFKVTVYVITRFRERRLL
jgi:hypothetical protein